LCKVTTGSQPLPAKTVGKGRGGGKRRMKKKSGGVEEVRKENEEWKGTGRGWAVMLTRPLCKNKTKTKT